MPPTREEIEIRLRAIVADHLDSMAAQNPDGFDLGVVALVTEIRYPTSPEDIEALLENRRRPEARYTPEAESPAYVSFTCSDSRDWIQGGLLHAALRSLGQEAEDADEEPDEAS